jgi:murein DD-endopeptidase MepM/ murein hydrolase activator NlpD
LPGHWQTLRISDPAPVQGETFALYVEMATRGDAIPETISGTLRFVDPAGVRAAYYYSDYVQTIPFHSLEGGFVALVGLDGFVSPGLYELALSDRPDGVPTWRQELLVRSGNYGIQLIRIPEEVANLLAPEVRSAEDAALAPIYETITPEPLWQMDAPLQAPVAQAFITARYGAVRSYNDGPFDIFHNGVDYAAPVNTPILAAAAGVVVFSDFTPLRGNLVIIDHGWGVMTAYYHMEQRLVALGEQVEAGQAVGGLGNTGLSTGAHLHWDVRVRNVPVNGLQWLQRPFP